jgi:L-2-hydroxyglutarate oxidase
VSSWPGDSIGVVGGGIVGLAIAREISNRYQGVGVTVFEKEDQVASHQSGHNSGVVHAGVYYQPNSLKGRLCRRGAGLLREYCQERGVRYRELGKLVVASAEKELSALDDIEKRALLNGVPGVRRVGSKEMEDIEPYVRGVSALYSPSTASVDYRGVCEALGEEIRGMEGEVRLNTPVTGLRETVTGVEVCSADQRWIFDRVIVCGGLYGDRLARLAGGLGELRTIPFRGEYYMLRSEVSHRVRGMIYPVPDPRYSFLGIHLTRNISDEVHVGPNAVFALALEGYRRRDIDFNDLRLMLSWPGTWRLVRRNWQHGSSELLSSLSKTLYVRQVRRYLADIETSDLISPSSGVRAQAVDRSGNLVDDFVLQEEGRILLVRNAPSPAATSSLAIAEYVVSLSSKP